MTQVMLEHFPLRSRSAVLRPASTKEIENSEGSVLRVTEDMETHKLHSGDGNSTIKGQCSMREALTEKKVQPTTGSRPSTSRWRTCSDRVIEGKE